MAKYSINYFVKSAGIMLFCCSILHALAAQNDIDSLRNRLHDARGIQKVEINYTIGSEFYSAFPDSATHYFQEALRLSRETGNDTFAARSLNKIGILNYNSGAYDKAISNLFSALKIFERYGDKWRIARCLQYLSMA